MEKGFLMPVTALQRIRMSSLPSMIFLLKHWVHIRSTNVIESTFATVRLRTNKTKGCGTRLATLTMVFKLACEAEEDLEEDKGI
jgi:transposase-like protein